ncbi:hypothetical protein GCM10023238_30620 [Streptomyces heliomycini]
MVYKLADEVTAGLEGMEVRCAWPSWAVWSNGPGEAREADLGVASATARGQIFVKGEVVQDRARVEDRSDADRGGDEDRRADGEGRHTRRGAGRHRELNSTESKGTERDDPGEHPQTT